MLGDNRKTIISLMGFQSSAFMPLTAIKLREKINIQNIRLTLVPKLQLGNAVSEALASRIIEARASRT